MAMATDKLREEMINEFRRAAGGSEKKKPAPEEKKEEEVKVFAETEEEDSGIRVPYAKLAGDSSGPDWCKVKQYHVDDWNEEVRSFIPEPYPEYIYREEDYIFTELVEKGELICLVGPPATGKDYMARQYAAHTRKPYMRVMGMRNVTPDMLLGKFVLEDASMKWVPGSVELMVRHGGVLVISEFAALPTDTAFAFQSLMERGGFLTLMEHPDPSQRMLKPHPAFRLVITSNVRGTGDNTDLYSATNVMDQSTLNRIESMLDIPYLSPEREAEMLVQHTGIEINTARKMVKLGGLIRTACKNGEFENSWSPRNLLAWGRISNMFKSVEKGFKYSYWGKLSEVERSTVKNYWHTVGFAKEL
jgi:cobaltochelatase CobS